MIRLISLVLFSLILIKSSEIADEEIKGKNFDEKIKVPDQYSLVMYYASWCAYCKETKPHFHRAAVTIGKNKDSKNKRFFTFNCEDQGNSEICSRESIEGYPTIKLYFEGKLVEEYFDENNEGSFTNYMLRPPKKGEGRKHPSSEAPDIPMENVLYLTAANFTLLKDYKEVLIFYYAPWCPHCTETKPKFSKAGKKFYAMKEKKNRIFAVMNCDKKENEAVCTEEKVDGFPTIRYYKKGEAWAEFEDEMTLDNFLNYFEKGTPSKKQKIQTLQERFSDKNSEKKKLNEGDKINWKSIKKVDSNAEFTKLVISPDNDRGSLVMFYAPWCGHCKSYKSHFIRAGEGLVSNRVLSNDVAFFAVDCDDLKTELSCNDEKITGYPTIVLFDKAGKRVKEMSTSMQDKSEIFKFIEEHLGLKKQESVTASSSMKDEL